MNCRKSWIGFGIFGALPVFIFLASRKGFQLPELTAGQKYREVGASLAVRESAAGLSREENVTRDKTIFHHLQISSHDSNVAKRFAHRQRHLRGACAIYQDRGQDRTKRYHFESIAQNRLLWCVIRKVGSSFVRRTQNFLAPLHKDNIWTGKQKRVLFVRDPYSRLMSGYLDRIVAFAPSWDTFGSYIVKKFRHQASDDRKFCGHDVTFPEFIKYFIHSHVTGMRKNGHYSPVYEMCELCHTEYDFIGHLETLEDDLDYILHSVNLKLKRSESDSDEFALKAKFSSIFRWFEEKGVKLRKCVSMCWILKRIWWSVQARGMISSHLEMPPSSCYMTNEQFVQTVLDAHTKSLSIMNKREQKRKYFVELFLQVPLKDRLKVRDILRRDFQLFEYDPQPLDIFPEFANSSGY